MPLSELESVQYALLGNQHYTTHQMYYNINHFHIGPIQRSKRQRQFERYNIYFKTRTLKLAPFFYTI